MLNHITANVRLRIAGHFRKQDLRRVVNEIARMCKKAARLGCPETSSEIVCQTQTKSQGARVKFLVRLSAAQYQMALSNSLDLSSPTRSVVHPQYQINRT
jgi:hypothetical protein